MRILSSLLAFLFLVALIRCSENEPGNNCVSPSKALDEVSSLSNIVNNSKVAGRPTCIVYAGASIYSCIYKGETTYYFVNSASSNSACVMIAYDCHGEELINWGSNQNAWTSFEGERSEESLLWEKK